MNFTKPLYRQGNTNIYYRDFVSSLKKVGVRKGDVVFVHSDISVFGKLAVMDADILLLALVDSIKESVGESGTVIMPTFCYSFGNNEVFDVLKTKSKVGVLTEFFRKQPCTVRTIQPIYSVAIWGKRKKELFYISKDSFDDNSIFGKLHKLNGKYLMLGSSFASSFTFLHFIEQSFGVSYRFKKAFKGKINHNNNIYSDEFTCFVRYLEKKIITDLSKFEIHLHKNQLIKQVEIGFGSLLSAQTSDLYTEGMKMLEKDEYCFLKTAPE